MALNGRLVTGPNLRGRLTASQGGAGIPDGSVTTDKIANLAVTTGKLANGAVTADKLAVTLTTTVTDGEMTITLA